MTIARLAGAIAVLAVLSCPSLAQQGQPPGPPPPERQNGGDPEAKWTACKQLADVSARAACYEAWHDDMVAHRPPPRDGAGPNQ
ncbi:hypothetical protein [Telmatospirillum sp.]|uniref:hypothetical protein n=1 Tax=Telmatospirillum sp. TaxID=2079197 RepID=UPI00283DFAE4|nr:hypothetical protein [Telmatospirillum sp.]MDR3437914.1 hypothetical protein [Telmatospirillum sp.]